MILEVMSPDVVLLLDYLTIISYLNVMTVINKLEMMWNRNGCCMF
jgi:hypothetical protein